jgi:multiple sugar transport system permease protein
VAKDSVFETLRMREGIRRAKMALVYLLLFFWAAICIFPLLWVAISSIKPPSEFVGQARYLPFIDFDPSLHAWRQLVVDPVDRTLLRFSNTVVVSICTTFLTVLTGAMATYGVKRSFPRSKTRERPRASS